MIYADYRLRAIGNIIEANYGLDESFAALTENSAGKVVPSLLGDGHLNGRNRVVSVSVYGDLGSGNKFRESINENRDVEGLMFDPSSCYARSEYELGIVPMFGGFSKAFLEEYHSLVSNTEPVTEYEDRTRRYEF